MNSRRLTVPLGLPVITFAVALLFSQFVIVADDASPKLPLYNAATPATCGLAIDVPLIVFVPLFNHVAKMPTPGAYPSTHEPKFENDALASLRSEAAVV